VSPTHIENLFFPHNGKQNEQLYFKLQKSKCLLTYTMWEEPNPGSSLLICFASSKLPSVSWRTTLPQKVTTSQYFNKSLLYALATQWHPLSFEMDDSESQGIKARGASPWPSKLSASRWRQSNSPLQRHSPQKKNI
jgi:hypothetical protein